VERFPVCLDDPKRQSILASFGLPLLLSVESGLKLVLDKFNR
jgi:hypothetical protein